jgi:hypothetical protein
MVLETNCRFEAHPYGFIASGDLLLRLGTIVSKVGWNILGLYPIGDCLIKYKFSLFCAFSIFTFVLMCVLIIFSKIYN